MKYLGMVLRALEALQAGQVATAHLRNARVSATDGPFAETNEQIG